jgi:hypothetical protein
MIRKWTKEEDDDNDDGDVSRLIAINICVYAYICVHDMLKKRKWIDVSLLRKEVKRERE